MNTSRILDKAHKGKGCVLAGAYFGKKVPVRPDSKPLKKGRDASCETKHKQRVAPRCPDWIWFKPHNPHPYIYYIKRKN